MRALLAVALFGVVLSALAEPRIYPPKRIGDYIIQTTEISTDRHNTWLVRIEDPIRGVVCYMQLGTYLSCVATVPSPASAASPPAATAAPSEKGGTR